jgi:6-phosphogluconate dehydrogenase
VCNRPHAGYYQFQPSLPEIAEVGRQGNVIRSRLPDLTATAFIDDPGLKNYAGRELISGEGRWTVAAKLDQDIPLSVVGAALGRRFESRGDARNTDRILSALRKQRSGHAEKTRGI